jgi:NADP-dependent 3-hydroxy acid dehydrogenase YdfG
MRFNSCLRRRALFRLGACILLSLPMAAIAETVLITGANSGIGLELTRQYAAKGWTVIATHRRSSTPESLAEVIAGQDNVRVERMDVTSAEQIDALAEKRSGVPTDLLINNAGVYNDRGDCTEDDCPGDWVRMWFPGCLSIIGGQRVVRLPDSFRWRSLRESNSCFSLERAAS